MGIKLTNFHKYCNSHLLTLVMVFTCIYPCLIDWSFSRLELHDHVVPQKDEHVGHKHDEEIVGGARAVAAGLDSIVDTEHEVETTSDDKQYQQG